MAALKTIDDSIRMLASRNYSVILRALNEQTQKKAAGLLNWHESSLSEFKDDHLEKAAQIMAAAGLKVVRSDTKTYSPQKIAALTLLARDGLDREAEDSGLGALDGVA